MNQFTRRLGIFSIVMITITSVDSLRNLPGIALFGTTLISFFIIAGLCFLIPSALVAAELSSTWPKTGGIYVWVREAFGKKWGFLAIWCQWIENVIWYPTILSFIAGALAFIISPTLADNKYYLISVILIVFWSLTFLNMAGIQLSAKFSEYCGMLGLVIPMLFIIILGVIWIAMGNPMQIQFDWHTALPSFKDPTLFVSLTAIVLAFCGMEIATVHGQDVHNPHRTYPIALLISVLFIFATMLLGALSIAVIVPQEKLSLVSGIIQAFRQYFVADHVSWMTPVIAICIILGALAGVSNWIIAPNRGLMVALKDNNIAQQLQYENRNGAPAKLLLYQAILVTILAAVYLLMPTVNSSYWVLTAMTAQVYMVMYIFMFAAAIRLRHSHPEYKRPFKIPLGKFGIWVVGIVGILTSLFTIFIGFYPPVQLHVSFENYEIVLVSGLFIMTCPPLIIIGIKHLYRKVIRSNKDVK